ncbi:MAG: hypothetical protein WCJ29_00180 [bacterium]
MLKQKLNIFERSVRFSLALIAFFSALAIFKNPLAQIGVIIFGGVMVLEVAMGRCWLAEKVGILEKSPKHKYGSLYRFALLLVQIVFGYEWLVSGVSKILNPAFIAGMSKSLGAFALNNPNGWYRDFLVSFAIGYADIFGYMVAWGELFVGLGLIFAAGFLMFESHENHRSLLALSVVTLLFGAFMSANFYFAAGWMSPSTHSLNMIMFWIQLVLAYVFGHMFVEEE